MCGEVVNKFVRKNGSSYRKLMVEQREIKIGIRADEIISIAELEHELENEKNKSHQLALDKEILQNRCEELYDHMLKFETQKREADSLRVENTNEIDKLVTKNRQLQSYIHKIGQDTEFENKSGKVAEVCDRQQRRKLKELKTHVEHALWFVETFGLKPQTVSFADETSAIFSMNYSDKAGKKSYQNLSEEEKQKVQSVLFVLDKLCIGEAAYHELTMIADGESLPRSYLIKQCKEELKKLCHITRTPGAPVGAQLEADILTISRGNFILVLSRSFKVSKYISECCPR